MSWKEYNSEQRQRYLDRLQTVEALIRDGLTHAEIAQRVRTTRTAITGLLSKARKSGDIATPQRSCVICHGPLSERQRTVCSKKCENRSGNRSRRTKRVDTESAGPAVFLAPLRERLDIRDFMYAGSSPMEW